MGKKWRARMKQWFVDKAELPADVVLDLPRVTMIGHLHLYIENHHGLLSFSSQQLELRLSTGKLQVQGENFVIKTILPEEILLEGNIQHVKFVESF